MKFVEAFAGVGRSGYLTDLPLRWKGESFKTPICLTYMRAGSVPHLTIDVLQHLGISKHLMLQTLPTSFEMKNAIKAHDKGISAFVGLPGCPFHISMQDPGIETPSGYNDKKSVSVWTHSGRKLISAKEFMDIQKAFKPASYQALCDSDTPRDCSNKRLEKSINHSLNFLDECIKEHMVSEELKETAIFGTIQGGYNMEFRRKSAMQTALRAVDGFVIDGFHLNGVNVRDLDFSNIRPILEEVIQSLPNDKPRILHGAFKPSTIVEAVQCGVDIFDSSYPYLATENGEALVFPFDTKFNSFDCENLKKKCKNNIFLQLSDSLYVDDFSPIEKDCTCYSCRHFTRAYINHLLLTSELLAKVLLMIHNTHHFSKFFSCIQHAVENNTLENLQTNLKGLF